jgi:hypothetical protein
MRLLLLCLFFTSSVSATTVSNTYITRIQAEGLEDPYNTLYMDADLSKSPCANTQARKRLAIVNETQHSTALAALLANKKVTVMGTDRCNSVGIETINFITIYKD